MSMSKLRYFQEDLSIANCCFIKKRVIYGQMCSDYLVCQVLVEL